MNASARHTLVGALVCAMGLITCGGPHMDMSVATGGTTEPLGVGICGGVPLFSLITAETLQGHVEALDAIAREHGGHRSAGSSGYDASVEYVMERLTAAGYAPQRHSFEYPTYVHHTQSQFEQVAPNPTVYVYGEHFTRSDYSGSGDVTAEVSAVDLELDPALESTSGCEQGDYEDFTPGHIALIQRGACTFREKVTQAQAAGAAAVVVFNSGMENQLAPIYMNLRGTELTIPVVGASFELGAELAGLAEAPEGLQLRVVVDGEMVPKTSENVIVSHPGGDPDSVLMLGAHLDSVPAGPGVNDNGSGTALVLALAEALAACDPVRSVQFGWWGAEELGLWGSTRYVEEMSGGERARMVAYLNFDMVASPNWARYVYKGDGPPGSETIAQLFVDYFAALDDRPATLTGLGGSSDYWPFRVAGIAVGGLFTGAGGKKPVELVEHFGGEGDIALDPCYHRECDDAANIHAEAHLEMAKAGAYVTQVLLSTNEPLVEGSDANVGLGPGLHDAQRPKASPEHTADHGHGDHDGCSSPAL